MRGKGLDRGRVACALALLAGLTAGAVPAHAAPAQFKSVTRGDRSDVPRNPDGSFSAADIMELNANYRPQGQLDLDMTFYGVIPASTAYTASWVVSAGACNDATTQGARVAVAMPIGDPAPASVAIAGQAAPLTVTTSVSADRRKLSVRISNPTIANQDYECLEAATATAGPGGAPAIVDSVERFRFSGYGAPIDPPPSTPQGPRSPACSDGADNDRDGTIDAQDLGCDSPQDNSENLTRVPTLTTAKARSLTRAALAKRYGRSFARGAHYHRDCRRKTRLAVTCRVAWRTRTASYRGTVSVASAQLGEKVYPVTKVAVHKTRRHRT